MRCTKQARETSKGVREADANPALLDCEARVARSYEGENESQRRRPSDMDAVVRLARVYDGASCLEGASQKINVFRHSDRTLISIKEGLLAVPRRVCAAAHQMEESSPPPGVALTRRCTPMVRLKEPLAQA